ncbi:hypothetical protein [Mesorhizobium sp. CAU 1741]|uniref:hypothetical protein n=1 Tax=Mesorhizobium sp. CAU 1741 TaxID=3140366 RepID=UPI00325A8E1C
MSSPTYGTGKTASAQLMEDVSGVLAIGPGGPRTPEVAYNARPELVRPPSLEVLPEPQQDMASAENPAWPEAPEQRRARIRAEATANQNNPLYQSPVTSGGFAARSAAEVADARNSQGARMTDAQRAEMEKRQRQLNQGDSNKRRYLSEPPVDYRQPAETAAAGELGVDEWQKERQRQKASGDRTWRDFVPWL